MSHFFCHLQLKIQVACQFCSQFLSYGRSCITWFWQKNIKIEENPHDFNSCLVYCYTEMSCKSCKGDKGPRQVQQALQNLLLLKKVLWRKACYKLVFNTPSKNTPQNSSTYKKYEYGHLGRRYIEWIIHGSFLYSNQIFQKIKLLLAKLCSLWQVNFVIPILFFLTLTLECSLLYYSAAFSIEALSTKKGYFNLFKIFIKKFKS